MGVRALDRKLLRDLMRLKSQVLAIALVMASGVAVLVMSLTAVEALDHSATAYYERYRFGDIWASVVRAPDSVVEQLKQIPGVRSVEARVVRHALIEVDGFDEPVVAEMVSLPEGREALLNHIALRVGRMPQPGNAGEVVMSEPFAQAHALRVGDRISGVVNGHRKSFLVVGLALSPEYIYTIGPGALMPDDRRFGVIWMGREALQAAFDLGGSFNNVSLGLLRGSEVKAVIGHVDELLARYGGVGAHARTDQPSNWFLMNEIEQLRTLASILPVIFLGVAAFLTHMVLARLISVERSEIGLLKAFGYGNGALLMYYGKMVVLISLVGVLPGWFTGYWLGLYNTHTYAEFFRFPFLLYEPGPRPFVLAALVNTGAALFGALSALRRVARITPAESMQPPSPPSFRRTWLSRPEVSRWMDQPTRIILRQIARWPMRAFMTSAGIGMSVALLVTSLQWIDAIDHLADIHFDQAQRQDVSVGFAQTRATTALRALEQLPGVMASEPMRAVGVRLRAGSRAHRGSLLGVPARPRLHLVYDAGGRSMDLPPDGLVLSSVRADILDVGVGDTVQVEVLEGRRPVLDIPVAAIFATYMGTPAYMEIRALNRYLGERPAMSAAHLKVDPNQSQQLFRQLMVIPQVSAVTIKRATLDMFHDTMAETILIFVSFFTFFSCVLAFGVTYNASRIALSERGRELATLRVLGFSRVEISYILLGEAALLTVLALPLGCLIGYALVFVFISGFETELYRIPMVIQSDTYAWAMVTTMTASAGSAILVRRRLDRLDLISVLKTRE